MGFAVADDGAALLGFTNAFNAPGAITISIDTTVDGCASQQLTLVNKASSSAAAIEQFNSTLTSDTEQAADGVVSHAAI